MMVILGFYGVGEFWKNFQNVHAPPGGTKFVARRHTRSVTLSSWTCSDMGSQCEVSFGLCESRVEICWLWY